MSGTDDRIRTFEDTVLMLALEEVSTSPSLLKEYKAEVVTKRPSADDAAEELLGSLEGAMRRRAGPSLVLTNRSAPPDVSSLGGRYVMTVFYDVDQDVVCASPACLFWMRFNNKLHVFNHRYDNDVAHHCAEDVTRPQVLNHILNSFDFYKIHALSEQPFPGYR